MEFLSFETTLFVLVTVFITASPGYAMKSGLRPVRMHVYTLPGSVAMLFGIYCTHWTSFILLSYLFSIAWIGLVGLSLIFLEPARQIGTDDDLPTTPQKSIGAKLFLIKK